MSLTPSTMLELGTPAPDFALPDVNGQTVARSDLAGRPLLVMFICNHCPFVKHLFGGLAALGTDYAETDLAIVGINCNDVANYPDDSPALMKTASAELGFTFPYLFDASQESAKAYTAACTPDFFLFDREHLLVYRGQFDASRPGNDLPVTGEDIRAAADAVLAGKSPSPDQTASIGCNIKWIAGNEPPYA